MTVEIKTEKMRLDETLLSYGFNRVNNSQADGQSYSYPGQSEIYNSINREIQEELALLKNHKMQGDKFYLPKRHAQAGYYIVVLGKKEERELYILFQWKKITRLDPTKSIKLEKSPDQFLVSQGFCECRIY